MARPLQVNLRLSESHYRVLEALALLRESPKAAVLLPVVNTYLEEEANDPAVLEAMEALKALRARGTDGSQELE